MTSAGPGGGSPGRGGSEDDKRLMAIACLAAKFSEDPHTKVGVCIVNQENDIVGTGYNRMPKGTEGLPWDNDKENELDNKYLYVCHAGLNAIINTNMTDLSGCTIYTTLFPSNDCAKIIIQTGVKKVIYLDDKYHDRNDTVASRRMLDLAKVEYSAYTQNTSPSPGEGNPKNLAEDFMDKAKEAARKSEDPKTKVGVCIVDQKDKFVGSGYNRMPNGTEGLTWDTDEENPLNDKHSYVCYAVLDAIMSTNRADLSGCTMYTTLFPCCECDKLIIQAGVKKLVYLSDKQHNRDDMVASREMLESAKVEYRQYPLRTDAESAKITIDFTSFYGPGEV